MSGGVHPHGDCAGCRTVTAKLDEMQAMIDLLNGEVKAAETKSGLDNAVAQVRAQMQAECDELALERDGAKHSRTCQNNIASGGTEGPCLRCRVEGLTFAQNLTVELDKLAYTKRLAEEYTQAKLDKRALQDELDQVRYREAATFDELKARRKKLISHKAVMEKQDDEIKRLRLSVRAYEDIQALEVQRANEQAQEIAQLREAFSSARGTSLRWQHEADKQAQEIEKLHEISLDVMRERDSLRVGVEQAVWNLAGRSTTSPVWRAPSAVTTAGGALQGVSGAAGGPVKAFPGGGAGQRLSFDAWGLGLAAAVAARATCLRRAVGAVLLDGCGRVLATGYNGPSAGAPHCNERRARHRPQDLPYDYPNACPGATAPSGTALDECAAIHAEANALVWCRELDRIVTACVTCSPCVGCVKLLLGTACRRVVFREEYPAPAAREFWIAAGREWRRL